ncbi:serine protease 29 [Biomphalaria pfeifferi]|uniref:Serine protease 29 n=1 Tax=Biomphalaria pfeifferi TaxID=112525 RepID=A0AAD8EZJ0_BIOPF|nr:serine protease 29 [Biomphalaria pfeifferi]
MIGSISRSIFFITLFVKMQSSSDFMDPEPDCDILIPAPDSMQSNYYEEYKKLFGFDETVTRPKEWIIDQALVVSQKIYPRCGNMDQVTPVTSIEDIVQQSKNMWPWIVRFLSDYNCFGSYLSPRWIITSASCIKTNLLIVRRPNYDLTGETVFVSTFFLHEEYDRINGKNDIALISLDEGDYIRPVCLPMLNIALEHKDTVCYLIGYASAERLHLFQWKVNFEDSYICDAALQNSSMYVESHACVSPELRYEERCLKGKGGHPVSCFYGFSWHVVAVTSPRQLDCTQDFHNDLIFVTNITSFVPWIYSVVKHKVDD